MEFAWTPEQALFRHTVRAFMERECPREYVRECDEEERYPTEILQKVAAQGWYGLTLPVEYGGMGADVLYFAILLEETARVMLEVARELHKTVGTIGRPFVLYASPALKDAYLPGLARGEFTLAFGLTEPEAGSDAAALKTTARLDGDDFVINGTKSFCSTADIARRMMLAVRTDPEAERHRGISLLLVDPRAPGATVRRVRTLGARATSTCMVYLSDVRSPRSELIGELNHGWSYVLEGLDQERVDHGAICAGTAQAVFEDALAYARQRQQFGRTLVSFQAIRHKLADMQVQISAARLLTYQAAWKLTRREPCALEAAIAKLYAGEAYVRIASQGLQIAGGWGYLAESDFQRHYRDSKLYEIAGGAAEVMRNLIARQVGA